MKKLHNKINNDKYRESFLVDGNLLKNKMTFNDLATAKFYAKSYRRRIGNTYRYKIYKYNDKYILFDNE